MQTFALYALDVVLLSFSQIELKSFDLAKESLAFSNIFLKFAT